MKLAPDITLHIGIMAVPERRERVTRLLNQLRLGDSSVAWDVNHEGHMINWWRAVDLASRGNPTHVLILEDDAEPCRDLIPAVEKIAAAYPDRIVSLFSAKHGAAKSSSITLVEHYGLSDVAVVYPRKFLEKLRQDYENQRDQLANARWQAGQGADEMRMKLQPLQKSWSTMPSLVQHGAPNESTLGHNFARSTASSFIGADTSALMLDWSQL